MEGCWSNYSKEYQKTVIDIWVNICLEDLLLSCKPRPIAHIQLSTVINAGTFLILTVLMLASVAVDGPTLKQYWVNASCLLGGLHHISTDV